MIGFIWDLSELGTLISKLTRLEAKLMDRETLHTKMRNYQRSRWKENLYSEGTIYGPWPALSDFTRRVRMERGIQQPTPILYQINHGGKPRNIKNMQNYMRKSSNPRANGGGLLHAWVETNILADVFLAQGSNASTVWKFKASGDADDGSYALFHDSADGYTTGATSMYPNFAVPSRRIFSGGGGDKEDADAYKAETEKYIDDVIARLGF